MTRQRPIPVPARCPAHPRYQGARPPRASCGVCWAIYVRGGPRGQPGAVSRRAERADREARSRTGGTLRAAYWPMLGGAAPTCAPRDHAAAAAFVAKIEAAIDRGGWSRNEWRNLHALYERWSARATGRDPRFDEAGTRPGRLDRGIEAWIRRRRKIFRTADWLRVAHPLRALNAADPRTRPSPEVLAARARRRRRRQQRTD